MKRRAFLLASGQSLAFALTPDATRDGLPFWEQQTQVAADTLEQRIARRLQAYDAQGNHRTGTEVDNISAQWLADQARHAGAHVSLEPFSFSRVDIQTCFLRIGDHRADTVPLFDAGFTGPAGVEGSLG